MLVFGVSLLLVWFCCCCFVRFVVSWFMVTVNSVALYNSCLNSVFELWIVAAWFVSVVALRC